MAVISIRSWLSWASAVCKKENTVRARWLNLKCMATIARSATAWLWRTACLQAIPIFSRRRHQRNAKKTRMIRYWFWRRGRGRKSSIWWRDFYEELGKQVWQCSLLPRFARSAQPRWSAWSAYSCNMRCRLGVDAQLVSDVLFPKFPVGLCPFIWAWHLWYGVLPVHVSPSLARDWLRFVIFLQVSMCILLSWSRDCFQWSQNIEVRFN